MHNSIRKYFVGNLVTAAPPQYSSAIRLCWWIVHDKCSSSILFDVVTDCECEMVTKLDKSQSTILFEVKSSNIKVSVSLHSSERQCSSVFCESRATLWLFVAHYRKDNSLIVAAEAHEMTTDCSSYIWLWVSWKGDVIFHASDYGQLFSKRCQLSRHSQLHFRTNSVLTRHILSASMGGSTLGQGRGHVPPRFTCCPHPRFKSQLEKCRPIWSSYFFWFRRTEKMDSVMKGLMGQSPRIFGLEPPLSCSLQNLQYSQADANIWKVMQRKV